MIVSIPFIFVYFIAAEGAPGDLSKQMCKKYTNYVPDSYKCPFSDSEPSIGNYFASEEEFPFVVALGYNDKGTYRWATSGALISENFVLTSGHGLINRALDSPVVVRIGSTNLSSTENWQEIKIKEVIPHPDYNPSSVYNDIGLVKLERKVDINKFARPACLFTEQEIGREKVTTTGWGATELGGGISDDLQKVNLDIFNEQQCSNTYKTSSPRLERGITYDTMLCAGSKKAEVYLPQGGGSLSIPHKGFKCIHDIIGVSSFGKAISSVNVPDVYTRVSAYIPWIEEIVWK